MRTGPHPMPGATSDAIIETQKIIVHGHRRISDLPALGAGGCGSAPRRAAGIPHRRADGPRPAGGLLHRRLHDPPRPALRDPSPHGILHRRGIGGAGALCGGQKGRARRKGEAAGGTLFGDAAYQGREVGPAEQDHPGHTVLRGLHRIERLDVRRCSAYIAIGFFARYGFLLLFSSEMHSVYGSGTASAASLALAAALVSIGLVASLIRRNRRLHAGRSRPQRCQRHHVHAVGTPVGI